MRLFVYMFLVMSIVGFAPSNGDQMGVRDGDPQLFDDEVQPVLEAHCAFLGCHGREGMPLSLYAVSYLRLRDPEGRIDTSRPVLEEHTLSGVEVEHNRTGLAARIGESDSDDLDRFLRRLIPREDGGIRHAGVEVFDSLDDPDLDVLRRFLMTVQ